MSFLLEKLNIYQEKLLDLSSRNRMLNSNFQARSKQHFRFIDEVPNQLYERLSKGSMQFSSLPELPLRPKDENKKEFIEAYEQGIIIDPDYLSDLADIEEGNVDDINQSSEDAKNRLKDRIRKQLGYPDAPTKIKNLREHAIDHGINPDWTLPKSNLVKGSSKHMDNKIQTLLLPDELERYLKAITSRANSSVKETGVNPLYVCFGFLYWKESTHSDKNLHSPILMLQVEIDKTRKDKKHFISSTGENLIVNRILTEKLKRDFGINFPELNLNEENGTIDIEAFLDEVETSVANPKHWSVKHWASYGIYNAQNMAIFEDIEEIKKRQEHNVGDTALNAILSGEDNSDRSNVDLYDVDEKEFASIIPTLVTQSDASQYSAIIDAVQGRNLVISGPPGTGKSQTITNIISAFIAKHKKVLFVAQKQAALDVVRNNLEAAGLKHFLLEVFSIKGTKKEVFQSIYDRRTMNPIKRNNAAANIYSKYQETKKLLNEYSQIMSNDPIGTGLTVHDLMWDLPELPEFIVDDTDVLDVLGSTISKNMTQDRLDNDLRDLVHLKDEHKRIFEGKVIDDYSISNVKKIINPFEVEKIKKRISETSKAFEESLLKIHALKKAKPYLDEITTLNAQQTKKLLEFINESLNNTDSLIYIKLLANTEVAEKIIQYQEVKNLFNEAENSYFSKKEIAENKIDTSKKIYSDEDISFAIQQLKYSSIFSIFSGKWRNAKSIANDLIINSKGVKGRELATILFDYIDFKKNSISIKANLDDQKQQINELYDSILLTDSIYKELAEKFDNDLYQTYLKQADNFSRYLIGKVINSPAEIKEYLNLIKDVDEVRSKVIELLKFLKVENTFSDQETISFFNDILNSPIPLKLYSEWLVAEDNINRKDLYKFYKEYVKHAKDLDSISIVYKHVVRLNQLTEIYNLNSIYNFNPDYIEKLRKDLSQYDEEVLNANRNNVAYSAADNKHVPPPGRSSGKVSQKTELGLLDHVLSKNSPRTSIREIFSRAFKSVSYFKPCTLMSPATVSQTLSPFNIYDLVIIDEASQMPPEFSIGALARAKQAIIVGDMKQLPPTRFYQSNNDTDEFEDDIEESILDAAITTLPSRQLLYHYRSRHQDLIRFSNNEFYKNLLIPVTSSEDDQRGIEHIYLEDGLYITGKEGSPGGVNMVEAKYVAKQAIKLMKTRPNESIGIATMNIKQRDLIESEFSLASRDDPEVESYLNYWLEQDLGINEFFIKNLENVQGDERDIIIISTVYGPDQHGNIYQRFGPINSKHGARRLNVLFTRAKHQIFLITSLKDEEIRVSDESSEGLKVFQRYLKYSKTKFIENESINEREVESPFQQWAIDVIESLPGYTAEWEVGQAGYRIDIAVKHESYPNGYILAVETDGATYHSSKAARDRDLLRQNILEGFGWVFHRIWSTDWITDPGGVREKLVRVLDERIKTLQNNS